MYVYLVPTVLSIDNGTNFKIEYESFVKKDGFDENGINLSNSPFYKSEAIKVIKEHKLALAKSALLSAVTFFTHDGMLTILGYAGVTIPNTVTRPAIALLAHPGELIRTLGAYIQSPAVLILIMRLVWILITVLFAIGVVLLIRKEKYSPHILAALLITLYFAATTCINGLGVNARFRVPVNVFIFSFAMYALFAIKERTLSTRS
jgi:hypothetical protein